MMTTKKEEEKEIIQYGSLYGSIIQDNIFWDDMEILKKEIIKYKITNIKIYYNSGTEDLYPHYEEEDMFINEEDQKNKEKNFIEEKYIVGLKLTYKNLYNGEIKVLEHKGNDQIAGMKELVIKGSEYLKQFHINFQNDLKRISQISFVTNKNNEISVGIKDGQDKTEEKNEEDNVIVGCFGHYSKVINAIGCIYVDKKIYIQKHLFGFFLLRKFALNKKEFKKKWDNNFKNLEMSFQFMWKTANLPDAVFAKIIGFCFL